MAAPTHSGDNSADDSLLHSSRRYTERARQVSRVLDWLLAEWPAHGQLDAQRVGIFGFSAGALTALIEVGARPDFSLVAAHCAAMQDPFCTFGGSVPGAPATRLEQVPDDAWPHETRFRAAVAAAPPMGFALNVAAVHVPVQLWRAEKDEQLGYPWHAEAVHAALPDAEYRVVPGASHMAFVAPCPPQLALPSVCGDPPGFDRAAFHASLNAAVVEFFKRTLTPD